MPTCSLILITFIKTRRKSREIVLPGWLSLTGDGVKQRVRQKHVEECNLHTIIRLTQLGVSTVCYQGPIYFFTKGTPYQRSVVLYEHRLPEGQKPTTKPNRYKPKSLTLIKTWWNNRYESDLV